VNAPPVLRVMGIDRLVMFHDFWQHRVAMEKVAKFYTFELRVVVNLTVRDEVSTQFNFPSIN
jgi:hypothetical protein